MDGIANEEKEMNRTRVRYSDLNARQQENYNSAKLSAILADYGYFTMWLNDDYNGADMIALREGQEALLIKLKSRPFIGKKYRNKGLLIGLPVGD